jgi:UDP-2,4-diacetamido-2,4,6-trideoxy-beta-L-altropyranose hydrolase
LCEPQKRGSILDEVDDARQTIFLTGFQKWDWVIVDNYSLSYIWEQEVKLISKKIFVIDDMANRKHTCDLLLDQNYEEVSRYLPIVNKSCELLLGPKYFLLNSNLIKYKKLSQNKTIKKILIYFGGSDVKDLTGRALRALSRKPFDQIRVDIVYGIHYQFLDQLKNQAEIRGGVQIYGPQPHLGQLMRDADVGIGAGGISSWERLYIGVPSIVVSVAENQVPISKYLAKIGLIEYLGDSEIVTESDISNAIQTISLDNKLNIGHQLCDGLGTSRVVDKIIRLGK